MANARSGIQEATREGTAAEVTERGKEVAGKAQEEAAAVVDEAKLQARTVVEDARQQLRDQAEEQAGKVADALYRMTDQLRALAEGNPDEAGPAREYLQEASSKLDELATRVDERGLQGLADDLAGFARRRPGAFLAGAAAAGFVAGRILRSSGSGGDAGAQPSRAGAGQARQSARQPTRGVVGTGVTAAPPTGRGPETIDLRDEHEEAGDAR